MRPQPPSSPHPFGKDINFLGDVPLTVTVEFGRSSCSIRKLLGLKASSVVPLEREASEPLEIRANGRLIARGEVVVVNDHYGIRITEIVSPEGSELES